jgi:hypothetical protein
VNKPKRPPDLATHIAKTGFVLENQIAEDLKAAGWTVISNRYYLDDTGDETVREVDLIGYRVRKHQAFHVYTVLIISCKKSEDYAWTLLARPIDLKDPNADWWPLHAWSNNKAIAFQLGLSGGAKRYHDDVSRLGVTEALQLPTVEVFAFQEMDKSNGAPRNQANIFNSLTALMKAQSYEMTSLPQRRKDPVIYQFNLLSVVDADLLRLHFENKKITAHPIDSEHYIARYIIRKQTSFSRIRFIHADAFSRYLADYDRLHNANCTWFSDQLTKFYDGAVTSWEKTDVFIEDFRRSAGWHIKWRLTEERNVEVALKDIGLEWRAFEGKPAVTVGVNNQALTWLNQDEKSRQYAARGLRDIYRYEGDFFFDVEEVPF